MQLFFETKQLKSRPFRAVFFISYFARLYGQHTFILWKGILWNPFMTKGNLGKWVTY